MALKGLILDLVSQAFTIVDDLAVVATFVQHTGSTYDAASGATTEATTLFPNIKMVMPKFSAEEKDDEVKIFTDSKCLIPAKDLPVVPNINDEITTATASWDVIRILGVPGDSLYILHVRKIR